MYNIIFFHFFKNPTKNYCCAFNLTKNSFGAMAGVCSLEMTSHRGPMYEL